MRNIKEETWSIEWEKLVEYDEDSPTCLKWIVSTSPRIRVGETAGSFNTKGSCSIQYNNFSYSVCAIIWYLHNGPLEYGKILTRIDGDDFNLRISNIQPTTHQKVSTIVRSTFNKNINANILFHSGKFWIKYGKTWYESHSNIEDARLRRDVIIRNLHEELGVLQCTHD